MLVADVAINPVGEKQLLLAQSFMPAQDMHILKTPSPENASPWFAVPAMGEPLVTPEWIFPPGSLRRWRN